MTIDEMKYAITTALVLFSIEPALAFDSQKWAQVDDGTREWFRGLHNEYGTSCCDVSDGSRVDDVDWRGTNGDGSYDVNYDGMWHNVEHQRILKGRNRLGYAIIWRNPSVEQPYCFLPGTQG